MHTVIAQKILNEKRKQETILAVFNYKCSLWVAQEILIPAPSVHSSLRTDSPVGKGGEAGGTLHVTKQQVSLLAGYVHSVLSDQIRTDNTGLPE